MRVFRLLAALIASAAAAEVDPFLRATPVEGATFSFDRANDLDFDRWPDDWTRRTGEGFPNYINVEIDPEVAFEGSQSLRVDAGGGKAALYSPPIPISPHQSYLFGGRVRTSGLRHDAAVLSLSFLDARKRRVRRVLGPPVSGTSDAWPEVRIGPVMPTREVRYVCVGVHLVHGEAMDYAGSAWLDDFSLRMLPRLSIRTNFEAQFRAGEVPLDVEAHVSGLTEAGDHELRLRLEDADFALREGVAFPLESGAAGDGVAAETTVRKWTLPPQENGFYRLTAQLVRGGVVVLEESTSLAVLDHRPRGESDPRPGFGWSIQTWPQEFDAGRLLAVAEEAGIGWLKVPLWTSAAAAEEDAAREGRLPQLLTELRRRGIEPVGVLREPPREIRRKFADDWAGVSELFSMTPAFWLPSVEPVMTRYGSLVHYWQLGGEGDASFVGLPGLPGLLDRLKLQFDRLGRDATLGVRWQWGRPVPPNAGGNRPFLSLSDSPPLGEADLVRLLEKTRPSGFGRWPLLRPRPATLADSPAARRRDLDRRAADLLKRMVAARIGGADVVFAADVFAPRTGLLNPDGSPGELFLPWRTWSMTLEGAEYLGSFRLPRQSVNHVFVRGEEAIVCLWSTAPETELISLGPDLRVLNLWGQTSTPPLVAGQHEVAAGPVPVLLRGGSARLARFRLGTRFAKGRMPSSTDEFPDELIVLNPFPQGVSLEAEIQVPRDWEVRPRFVQRTLAAEEEVRVPVLFRVPSHQSLGPQPLRLRFRLDADNFYEFTVHRDYTVGLGDVTIDVETAFLPDGSVEVQQRIVNNTPETLSFDVSLYVPGQKRKSRRVAGLSEGQSNVLSYRVPDGKSLIGQRFRIRAEQEGGNRVLNKTFTLTP